MCSDVHWPPVHYVKLKGRDTMLSRPAAPTHRSAPATDRGAHRANGSIKRVPFDRAAWLERTTRRRQDEFMQHHATALSLQSGTRKVRDYADLVSGLIARRGSEATWRAWTHEDSPRRTTQFATLHSVRRPPTYRARTAAAAVPMATAPTWLAKAWPPVSHEELAEQPELAMQFAAPAPSMPSQRTRGSMARPDRASMAPTPPASSAPVHAARRHAPRMPPRTASSTSTTMRSAARDANHDKYSLASERIKKELMEEYNLARAQAVEEYSLGEVYRAYHESDSHMHRLR